MSDEIPSYGGRLIDAMTIDELRAALMESWRHGRALMELHEAHIKMLRNLIQRDDNEQRRLFMEYAK